MPRFRLKTPVQIRMPSERDSLRGSRRSPALGAAFLAAQTLSLNAISLFTTAFIVRQLGPLQYGEWAAAASLAAAHLVITNVGLRTLFVRDVARRPEDAADLLAEQLGLRLALGALAGAIAIVVCVLVGYPPVVTACMVVGCVWILLSVVGSTLGDVLQAMERFGTYSAVGVVSGLAVTTASVVAVLAGSGPIALSVAYLAQPVVSVWLLGREARRHVRLGVRWDWQSAKRLLKESRVLGASAVAAAAGDRAVQLLVPAVVGLEAFGVFSAGTIVADRLGNVPDAVATAFYPWVSRAAVEPGQSNGEPASSMLTIGLAACVPMAVVGAYLARPIARTLLPHDSQVGASVIQVTMLALPLLALSTGMSFCLQAAGRHNTAARVGIGASLFSVALSALCVTMSGTVGASWALVARPAILALALAPVFHATFPGALRRLPLFRILISSAGLAALCHLTRDRHVVIAVGSSLASVGVYAAGLMAMRVFSVSDVFRLLSRTGDQR